MVLAVKPYQVEAVLSGMKGALSADNVLISIAAGVSLDTLKKFSRGVCPVVRCMPNTPALVAKGVFAFSFEDSRLSEEQKRDILDIFSALGSCPVYSFRISLKTTNARKRACSVETYEI